MSVNSTVLSPSDANFHRSNDFLPDRFLPECHRPVEFKNDRRNNQKPFGLGGRSCLGKLVALAELRLVLARLVWNFDLSVAPERQINWMDLKTYIVVQKEPIKIMINAMSPAKT